MYSMCHSQQLRDKQDEANKRMSPLVQSTACWNLLNVPLQGEETDIHRGRPCTVEVFKTKGFQCIR